MFFEEIFLYTTHLKNVGVFFSCISLFFKHLLSLLILATFVKNKGLNLVRPTHSKPIYFYLFSLWKNYHNPASKSIRWHLWISKISTIFQRSHRCADFFCPFQKEISGLILTRQYNLTAIVVHRQVYTNFVYATNSIHRYLRDKSMHHAFVDICGLFFAWLTPILPFMNSYVIS